MKQNLDELKTEMASYLQANGFAVFHGFSRNTDGGPEVEWDTMHYPDYKQFLHIAKELGIKLIVLHHRDFSSAIIDRAIDELAGSPMEYQEQRQVEQRLRELAMYDGFTCMVEMSFDFQDTIYLYELRTDWFNELNVILDELDLHSGMESDSEDEGPLGGYYSKN
jgi:hypothetical protein